MAEGIDRLKEILPQRYPFLMLDRIVELDPGKRAIAYKNLSANDWFFEGSVSGKPEMPGSLVLEAMAQTSILLYHSAYEKGLAKKPQYYLGQVNSRFMEPAYPGDQLRIVAETVRLLATGAFVNAKAFVGDKNIAEAELIFAVK
jgi:3-hydroxyacyl-[acyl-carrier-protein] dehydratase